MTCARSPSGRRARPPSRNDMPKCAKLGRSNSARRASVEVLAVDERQAGEEQVGRVRSSLCARLAGPDQGLWADPRCATTHRRCGLSLRAGAASCVLRLPERPAPPIRAQPPAQSHIRCCTALSQLHAAGAAMRRREETRGAAGWATRLRRRPRCETGQVPASGGPTLIRRLCRRACRHLWRRCCCCVCGDRRTLGCCTGARHPAPRARARVPGVMEACWRRPLPHSLPIFQPQLLHPFLPTSHARVARLQPASTSLAPLSPSHPHSRRRIGCPRASSSTATRVLVLQRAAARSPAPPLRALRRTAAPCPSPHRRSVPFAAPPLLRISQHRS
jgi:hypothetical protein